MSYIPIISEVVGLGADWLRGKQEKTRIKAEAEADVLRKSSADIDTWEKIQARASAKSWKDEYLTVVFSIPAIAEYWQNGMEGLSSMPFWYQSLLGIMFAASFGIRKATKLFAVRRA